MLRGWVSVLGAYLILDVVAGALLLEASTCRSSVSPIDDNLQTLSTASIFKVHALPLWADNNLNLSRINYSIYL